MEDEAIRLKCLELAQKDESTLETLMMKSKKFYDFIRGKSDTEIDAALQKFNQNQNL